MKQTELNKFIKETSEQALEQLDKFFRSPEDIKEYIDFASQFYNYSNRNQMLIANQNKGASIVAPYKKWQQLDAQVMKGEKAIKIMVPSERKTFVRHNGEDKNIVPISKATAEEKDKIKNNQIKVNKSITFVKGNVFDIRQTNLPEDKYPQMLQQLRGSVPDYDEKISNLTKIANSFDINVQQSKDSMEGARGAYIETNSGQKVIELNKNNEEKQNTKTMIHELGHALIHGKDKIVEPNQDLKKEDREFQAEMTALIVGKYMGLDNDDYSIKYIHGYANKMDNSQKMDLMKDVQKASSELIKAIDGNDSKQIYLEANQNKDRAYIKPVNIKNNSFMRENQLYTVQDVNFFSKEMYSQFTPQMVYNSPKDNRTKILQGREYSYAPNQTELSQPNFYDYLRQYVAPQEQSGRKMVNNEERIDNRSNFKPVENNKNVEIINDDNDLSR
ncbi:ArdC-like ssDNA-binding domain-containing protein [Staphylococcus haemolyticus]|uniref:ArdC-like ssDNA-binding domain-containing protein n=1 Tax=Staphylococcus haemolyticus TaxID=1283 RepID=UPI003CEBB22A